MNITNTVDRSHNNNISVIFFVEATQSMSQQIIEQRNADQQEENNFSVMHQQYANTLQVQRGPSTAEAALVRSHMDGTEKYQKISEIGKGKRKNIVYLKKFQK